MDRAATLKASILRGLEALLADDENRPPDTGRLAAEDRTALETVGAEIAANNWQTAHEDLLTVLPRVTHQPYRARLTNVRTDIVECARLAGIDILI
jgi:hypothetical protein